MDGESAFKPKFQKVEAPNSSEGREKIVGPLRSLEEDKAQIKGFNIALEGVLDGRITKSAQLQALANPRFGTNISNGGELLSVEGGGLAKILKKGGTPGTNTYLRIEDLQGANLTVEEVPILLKIIEERTDAEKEKNSAEAQIKGFNIALEGVLDGRITKSAQLQALANPRFGTNISNGGELLSVEGGGLAKILKKGGTPGTNTYLRIEDLQGANLTVEEVPILLKIIEERTDAEKEKNSAEAQIKGFNIALEGVLDGRITKSAQLQALANPRFGTNISNGGELLSVEGGGLAKILKKGGTPGTNTYLRIEDLQGANLTVEDQVLLTRLLQVVGNTAFPNEVRENLRKYVQTPDSQILERLNLILASTKDDSLSVEVDSIVEGIAKCQRIAELKRDVYRGIVENRPLTDISKRISDFEGREKSDLELVSKLQTALAAKRKRDAIEEATPDLQANGRNIDRLLREAARLLGSNREDEREAGVQLVKAAYRVEIANFKAGIQKMITKEVDPETLRIYIDGLPLRPAIEGFDYVQTIVETREKAFQSVGEILKARGLEEATRIRESFAQQGFGLILANIDNFPGETERDRAIKVQLLELYKSYVAANRPEIFDEKFAQEIRQREEEQLREQFVSPEKGKNKESFNFIRARFVETIYPLVESLRTDKTTASKVNNFLDPNQITPGGPSPRRQFEQRMSLLEKQRPLSEVEQSYLQSVEMLSVFNPYLVACAFADPGVTSEFLRHHFERLSKETTSTIKDGDYFPLIQIGLGPNGLAALGETVRNNPDLAASMLVVDAGKQPGGPFAIPEGPAWELNSANRRGAGGRTLPKAPKGNELETVRAYGSPLRWYPGERGGDKTIRQGSINATVDYLITPDDLSTARYPTNEELQLVLSMQAAVLTKEVALQTKVVGIDADLDTAGPRDAQGDLTRKIVTLEIKDQDGVHQVKVKTDALFASTGLGEAGYGFKLQGSKAEKVIAKSKGKGFPKISTTLEAFNSLSGRSLEKASPGETLVIWGRGNSADTLIENIGSIFQGDNPRVRDVTKVYVIADGDLSARPRYALINDLKPRNGRGNLIEQINARVVDVDFASAAGGPPSEKLAFYDNNGQVIKDRAGKPIFADSSIAATGFRSKLDSLLENYAAQKSGSKENLRKPLVLPTNKEVAVAETLASDPSVLILGTASKPEFDSVDKLGQLPIEAREALLRNGAENAVAIGFRAPDTQAAVNIWLNSQDVGVEKKSASTTRETLITDSAENVRPGETVWLERVVDPETERIPNNIEDEMRILSPLFAYNVGNSIELVDPSGKRFTGELSFVISFNPENQTLGLSVEPNTDAPVAKTVFEAVRKACLDRDFQKYALVALGKKRRNPKLEAVLSFRNGFVDPKATFIQD